MIAASAGGQWMASLMTATSRGDGTDFSGTYVGRERPVPLVSRVVLRAESLGVGLGVVLVVAAARRRGST